MESGDRDQSRVMVADCRLWAKSTDHLERPYPVLCHLMDTAAIAGALFDALMSPDLVGRLAAGLKVEPQVCRSLVMFWAGLHDIGKISVAFQAQCRDLCGSLWNDPAYITAPQTEDDARFGHDKAALYILADLLPDMGYSGRTDGAAHVFAQLLSRHHGRAHAALRPEEMRDPVGRFVTPLGEGEWQGQRSAHVRVIAELTGAAEASGVTQRPSSAAVAVVLGLVVCADWLASQESFITSAGRLPEEGWQATDKNVRRHWDAAVSDAPAVVRAAGLGRARFHPMPKDDAEFEARFGFPPNQLQASLIHQLPAMVRNSGLLLVTAPPGDGKTEASQLATLHFHEVAGAGGFAFGLPTMATTDAMFRRLKKFAELHLTDSAAIALMHSMAWLNSDFGALAEASVEGSPILTSEDADMVVASQWLRAGKRGILAPLGAMTIDQILAGVLPIRHNMLRMFGLVGKTVVIDEAHSYGPWMHALLLRALEWLGAMGSPVVVMSATLSGRTAQDLVDAYRRGVLGAVAAPSSVVPIYPGWLFVDGTSGAVSEPVPVGTSRPSDLYVELVPVAAGAEDVTGQVLERLSVISDLVDDLPRAGGCVLICCNTVAEAQATYNQLASTFVGVSGVSVQLDLLHSRFQSKDRARISSAAEAAYGKPDARGDSPSRPRASILVATQVVEQSIDLDFDLVITDLAPIALLLQRAGRGRRHERGPRPAWTNPARDCSTEAMGDTPTPRPRGARLVVLEPVDKDGAMAKPPQWGAVYFESLLKRTSRVLRERGQEPIVIPTDVQYLVDEVYAEDFVDRREQAGEQDLKELRDADNEYLGTLIAEQQLAANVMIKAPTAKAKNLAVELGDAQMTDGMEEFVVTRLGADSARVVLVYRQADGSRTLDARGTAPVDRPIAAAHVRQVMEHMVPVPGRWVSNHPAIGEAPAAWAKHPLLRGLVLAEGIADGDGWRSLHSPYLHYQGTSTGLHRD
ncbi:CRISPR-associated helicase Cas3' [Catenulispora sp. NL8]|uniref:CRISPR-associated helicase Cas3 n=1 Tax=Catenulispora pinistramenti TaxID=2705254 RepID=A0ABS5KN79_9ACTN|nr:CRISPR-associated helicase Cas3' [Catenulispora pinistramenti]MBS2547465.1 CRISPR-associated helicase Cas3' [Catenulispora pinistramenti]